MKIRKPLTLRRNVTPAAAQLRIRSVTVTWPAAWPSPGAGWGRSVSPGQAGVSVSRGHRAMVSSASRETAPRATALCSSTRRRMLRQADDAGWLNDKVNLNLGGDRHTKSILCLCSWLGTLMMIWLDLVWIWICQWNEDYFNFITICDPQKSCIYKCLKCFVKIDCNIFFWKMY